LLVACNATQLNQTLGFPFYTYNLEALLMLETWKGWTGWFFFAVDNPPCGLNVLAACLLPSIAFGLFLYRI
jgi:hypothetical protein